MKLYNRETKQIIEEEQYSAGLLNFLYNNVFGRTILKIVINPFFSKIGGFYNDLSISKHRIKKWIKNFNIDMNLYEKKEYKNFNEFFSRKLKNNEYTGEKTSFISPCEGKLIAYPIKDDLTIKVKNSTYTLKELIGQEPKEYKNGYCLVYYLSVDCYHRYCYIDSGSTLENHEIKGKLHTVSSISKDYKIYKENHRTYSILETENFGNIIQMEVGALLVGKIVNNNKEKFKKGEEKGYFKLGGSTIIILIKENTVKLDKDILENSKKGIATKVSYHEKIGVKHD